MATLKLVKPIRRNAKEPEPRLHAKRDRFTRQVIALSAGDFAAFESFRADFIRDLAPQSALEISLAASVAWDSWRLNRLRAIEMNLFALGADAPGTAVDCSHPELRGAMIDALAFAKDAETFSFISLFEQVLRRAVLDNLAALQALQADRRYRRGLDLADEVLAAQACDLNGTDYSAPTLPGENGFVFSNEEIAAASRRNRLRGTPEQANPRVRRAGAADRADSPSPERPEKRRKVDRRRQMTRTTNA